MYAYQTNHQILSVSQRFYQNIVISFQMQSYQMKYYNMIAHNLNKRCIYLYIYICSEPHISITVLDYSYEFQKYMVLSLKVKTYYYVAFTDHLQVHMLMI